MVVLILARERARSEADDTLTFLQDRFRPAVFVELDASFQESDAMLVEELDSSQECVSFVVPEDDLADICRLLDFSLVSDAIARALCHA